MAPKRITVDGVGGVKLSNDHGLDKLLNKRGVESLVDREGDAVVDFQTLVDGGKYTLGPPQQQQQQQHSEASAERLEKLAAFAEAAMHDKTENKPMSEASAAFAESILAAYRINHERPQAVVADSGSLENPPPYVWTIESKNGEIWNKSEHGGTPGALAWFREHLLGSNCNYDVKNVTGFSLPKVKGNRRSATGKADLAIGIGKDLIHGDPFEFVRGFVELKTDKYALKTGQNLLQLLSLSTASGFKKGVALLATNCNDRWEVCYFSAATTIKRCIYQHGRKAWEDYLQLIGSVSERNYPERLWTATLPEISEQDLEGFDMSVRDKKKARAEQEEAMLEHFADRLADVYGERPTVPSWARANARIPDYYA